MADPAPTPTDPAAPPADPAAPPVVPTNAKQPPWGDPENFDAAKAWELIQNLRTEKGDPAKQAELEQKVNDLTTAQQAQMDALAKALGLKPDDAPLDPAELAEQVTASQAETAVEKARADDAEKKMAVFLTAADHEANAVALLDSTSFLASIKDVDHTDAVKLGEAIKQAVEKDGRFKVTPGTPPFPGGPRSSAPSRAGSLGEAINNKLASTHP